MEPRSDTNKINNPDGINEKWIIGYEGL